MTPNEIATNVSGMAGETGEVAMSIMGTCSYVGTTWTTDDANTYD